MSSLAKVKLVFVATNKLLFWIRNLEESTKGKGGRVEKGKKKLRKTIKFIGKRKFCSHDGANWNECVRKNVISFSHFAYRKKREPNRLTFCSGLSDEGNRKWLRMCYVCYLENVCKCSMLQWWIVNIKWPWMICERNRTKRKEVRVIPDICNAESVVQ